MRVNRHLACAAVVVAATAVVVASWASTAMAVAPFTVAQLTDTHVGGDYNSNPAPGVAFQNAATWVANNRTAWNIVDMIHSGDIIHFQSNQPGDQIYREQEFQFSHNALFPLFNSAPGMTWGTCAGNHDVEVTGPTPSPGYYNTYIGAPSNFAGQSWYGGAATHGINGAYDSYQFFQAGGRNFLVINLQYYAGADARTWARGLMNTYSGMPTIINTHRYLTGGGLDTYGQFMWNDTIKNNSQVFMVTCGHNGPGRVTLNNDAGKSVFQIAMTHSQGLYSRGLVRRYQFDEDNSVIHATTCDAYIGAEVTDGDNQFDISVPTSFNDRFGSASLYLNAAYTTTWTQGYLASGVPGWREPLGATGQCPYAPWADHANAYFEGTAGTVNVNGTINAVDAMCTLVGGYTLGGGTITLANPAGSTAIYTVTGTTTINSVLASPGGGGMYKQGDGTLVLGTRETYTGGTTIYTGTLTLNANGDASGGVLTSSSGVSVENGGTLRMGAGTTCALGGWTAANIPAVTVNAGGTVTTDNGALCDFNNLTLNGGTISSGTPDPAWGSYGLLGNVTVGGGTTSTMSASNMVLFKTGGVAFNVGPGSTLNVTGTFADVPGTASKGLIKAGPGKMVLSGANTYSGGTTVNAGTLALGINNALPTGSNVTLSNGILATDGYSQTNSLGTLTLSGSSTIDMGDGSSTLRFADSHLMFWSSLLTISDWSGSLNGSGTDRLFFGSSASGLTISQLSEIVFANPGGLGGNYGARILSTGEIVPIPEPGTIVLLLTGLLGGVAYAWGRRTWL